MKHVIALFLLLAAPIGANAQASQPGPGHSLIVAADKGETFYLELDGKRINQVPLSHLSLTGLPNDRYKARIVFADRSLCAAEGSIECAGLEPGSHQLTYGVSSNGARAMLYSVSWRSLDGTTGGEGMPGQKRLSNHATARNPSLVAPASN